MLAVAVLGRAKRLISSHAAQPGQTLVMAVDLRGSFRGNGGAFNAATTAAAPQLRASLALLPELAEAGLVGAGKDISMAGTCGSLAMLLETSGVGAVLDLESDSGAGRGRAAALADGFSELWLRVGRRRKRGRASVRALRRRGDR